jgi:hypothetical protein
MTITIQKTESTIMLAQGPGDSYTSSDISDQAARAYGVYLKRSSATNVASIEESRILSTPDVVAGFDYVREQIEAWKQSH